MTLINIVPKIFCIILIIDFFIDDCCKDCYFSSVHINYEGGGGGDLKDSCVGLLIVCLMIIVILAIYSFFLGLTKVIGKNASRYCSLDTIFFFETLISIYCMHLHFMIDGAKKFVLIFGISLGLSIVNFFGFFIPLCRDCCLAFCSEYCSFCCISKRKSIINQLIVKQNNINEQKKDFLSNDFDAISIPIYTPSENAFEENNNNYNSSVYLNKNIYNNNYTENTPIDNITKANDAFDNDIERTGNDYDIATLPYGLQSEK